MKKILILFFFITSLTACKTHKNATDNAVLKSKSAKYIINKYEKNKFDKNTVSAKLKLRFEDKNTTQNLTASLRIAKGKKIWISVYAYGFGVAKVLITPERVSYYEKINKTYFDGDFSLLSDFLGTTLNYEQVENLLIGESILALKKQKFKAEMADNSYVLTPKKQAKLYQFLVSINPQNYKVSKQSITQENQNLTLSYNAYQKIDRTDFPKNLNIHITDKDNKAKLAIFYKTVSFNKTLKTPFKIPNGYTAININ